MSGRRSDEAVRREAHDWSMRMHGDDADLHRAAFERWRAADPRHAETYARLARQWASAALLAQSRIGRARALPAARAPRWAAPLGYAMAAAAIVLAIGLWFGVPGPRAGQGPAGPQIASRVGEIRTLKLADGSVITLDTDSTVKVEFSAEQRRVALTRGRARFDVAHEARRPFIVVAGSGAVVAHGTIFEVSLLGGRVRVTLLRGVVEVRNNGGEDRLPLAAAAVQLHPGERTQFVASEPPAPPRKASPAESAWVSGMLSFDADRLGDAIAQANRYSKVRIGLADPSLDSLKVTGAYRVGDANGFAQALAASLGLHALPQPNGDVVLARPSG